MPQGSRIARRAAVLPSEGDGSVRVLPAASRFSLRVKGVAVPARIPGREAPGRDGATVAGLPLDLPINRCAVAGERTIARLGPDEWLVIGPEAETEALAAGIADGLAGRFFSLVDISHRQVAFEVSSPHAADILNAGCPLDLHPRAFPPGAATRTLLGKAEIVLIRPGENSAFRVECWRSFAAYMQGFLLQAARDV